MSRSAEGAIGRSGVVRMLVLDGGVRYHGMEVGGIRDEVTDHSGHNIANRRGNVGKRSRIRMKEI